jgi:hypothetical protein
LTVLDYNDACPEDAIGCHLISYDLLEEGASFGVIGSAAPPGSGWPYPAEE